MIPSFLCGLFLFLLQLKIDNSGDADAFDAIHVCNIDVVNGDEAFDTGNLTEFKFKLAHGFYLIHLGFWPHDLDSTDVAARPHTEDGHDLCCIVRTDFILGKNLVDEGIDFSAKLIDEVADTAEFQNGSKIKSLSRHHPTAKAKRDAARTPAINCFLIIFVLLLPGRYVFSIVPKRFGQFVTKRKLQGGMIPYSSFLK